MNPLIRNILAVIVGWIGGSIINMGLIQIGHIVFPITGIDSSDMEALAAVLPSLGFEYFIFPFLAHAFGTLGGAVIAYFIGSSHKLKLSFIVGGLFLLGGIMVNYMLPGPTWFTVVDIIFAYIPMAWIGGKLVEMMLRNKVVAKE